jgi:hypothetical protein
MSFQKRILEENNFWRYALPIGGLAGGALLGHHLGHDFAQGMVDQTKHDTSIMGAAENLLKDGKNIPSVSQSVKDLVTLNGGSVHDIGRAYAHEQLKNQNTLQSILTNVDEEKAQRFINSHSQRGTVAGAAIGGLAGMLLRPKSKDK